MATYRIVEFRRDGLVGWTVESSAPVEAKRPRVLYPTSDKAQAAANRLAEADRLAAAPAAEGDVAATAAAATLEP
jgi:hypothetical protein